ncbi:MAG TPA: saccharopine dehydrogenase C-terminal domain-containing protein [Tepidisphaeraceae bacterium]|nr:saccharopine dehydrogenase C-terminal domain-containing protein [Tepidisphaeraceae bacterium]
MHRILLLGAGKIGSAIGCLLQACGDYRVTAGDVDAAALARIAETAGVGTRSIDASNPKSLAREMKSFDAVVSACSFAVNPGIAEAALKAGISYFDLTEDRQTTQKVSAIAKKAKSGQVFMPQCGLAPGFVSIAAYDLSRQFVRLDEVRMRVGALPLFPTNEMKYNLTWSTDGLINEYGNPCEAIHDGRLIEILPLEGLEHFSLDGVDYEAFNTSGGVGTLAQTLDGKVRALNYKTIRYRGHRDLMAFLLHELRLNDRRPLLKDILEQAVPVTPQDVVLIFCTVAGQKDGLLTQVTDARKVYHGECFGHRLSAIQITTAASLCAVLDLHFSGRLPKRGFVRQEEVKLDDFLANRFGRFYAHAKASV